VAYAPNGDILQGASATTVAPSTATTMIRTLYGTINGAGMSNLSVGTIATRSFAMADGTASPAGGYTSCVIEIEPTNSLGGVFFIDALIQAKSDLFQPAPGKIPYVFFANSDLDSLSTDITDGISPVPIVGIAKGQYPTALVDFGGGGESWDKVSYLSYRDASSISIPNGGGAPAAGQPDVPILVNQRLHGGLLGVSSLFEWQSSPQVYPDRDAGLTGFYIGEVFAKILDGVTVPTAVP